MAIGDSIKVSIPDADSISAAVAQQVEQAQSAGAGGRRISPIRSAPKANEWRRRQDSQ